MPQCSDGLFSRVKMQLVAHCVAQSPFFREPGSLPRRECSRVIGQSEARDEPLSEGSAETSITSWTFSEPGGSRPHSSGSADIRLLAADRTVEAAAVPYCLVTTFPSPGRFLPTRRDKWWNSCSFRRNKGEISGLIGCTGARVDANRPLGLPTWPAPTRDIRFTHHPHWPTTAPTPGTGR